MKRNKFDISCLNCKWFWISGENFTNVLQAAFTSAGPKSAKKYSQAVSLFCTLGVKAARKMLMKLIPDWHDNNFQLNVLYLIKPDIQLCQAWPWWNNFKDNNPQSVGTFDSAATKKILFQKQPSAVKERIQI